MPLTHWIIHSHAAELFATFCTESISLLAGSFKNLPKLFTTASDSPSRLNETKSFSNLGLLRFLTLAAHQSTYIFSVFSFFILSFGAGSINKHNPCITYLIAIGGFNIAFSSVRLLLSRTNNAFSAAFSLGIAIASYFSHYYFIALASLTASRTIFSSPRICLIITSAYSFCLLAIYILMTVSEAAFFSCGFIYSRLFFMLYTDCSVWIILALPFSYLKINCFICLRLSSNNCLKLTINSI